MLDWLRKRLSTLLTNEQDMRLARNVDRCLLELAQIRRELNERLTEKCWSVDKIVIEKLQADKVELNLGSIDVSDLSGMLSIGFNYGGKLIKVDPKGGGKATPWPHESSGGRGRDPAAKPVKTTVGKGEAPRSGSCSPDAARKPEKEQPGATASARIRPRLNIHFRGVKGR